MNAIATKTEEGAGSRSGGGIPNRAILRSEIIRAGQSYRDMYLASLSLARTQRRIAGEYRKWAREAEAAGRIDHYRRYAPMARETFRAALDHLSWARHFRNLAEWRL